MAAEIKEEADWSGRFSLYLFFFFSIDLFFINSVWFLGKEGKKIMVSQFC